MKIAIYSIAATAIAMFALVGILASSSYKRDVAHSNATKSINDNALVLPDHGRVYPVEIDGYKCFVTNQADAIWCNKIQ